MRTRQDPRLKKEHRIVLQALQAANIAYQSVVTVNEVTKTISLSSKDTRQLKETYSNSLNQTVAKILDQLRTRGLIFSPGMIGKQRYYGSPDALEPERRSLPSQETRRQRVLKIVKGAVEAVGRAVRIGDILEYAAKIPETHDLSSTDITHDVLSLKETGELIVLDNAQRGDERGFNLYLPAELNPEDYTPRQPLTWLQEVADCFFELWDERKKQAADAGRLPRPVSTADIRAKMLARPNPHKNMQKPQPVISAMIKLAQTSQALLRKIKRPGQKASLWVPLNIPDDQIDIGNAYVSDAERIGEAVKRAVVRLGRPVNQRDIKSEIKMDGMLQPAGSSSLTEAISDAARTLAGAGDGTRCKRVLRRVYRAGKVNGESYYYHSLDGLNDARVHVRLCKIRSQFETACIRDQINSLESCSLQSIAIGRAMMIAADAENISRALDRFLGSNHGESATRDEAKALHEQVCGDLIKVREWLGPRAAQNQGCPSDVIMSTPTWTAEELISIIKPLYPQAQQITDLNQLIRLLWGKIRRVPNPDFQHRFSKDSKLAAEFLFDRTDALLYAAKKWGGHECCFQAMLASSHLGWLRDDRFIFPVLKLKSFEERLIGVACLAFLQTRKSREQLRKIAVEDPSPAVREAALWACGFAKVEGAADLFVSRCTDETNPSVRMFAEAALNKDDASWWTV